MERLTHILARQAISRKGHLETDADAAAPITGQVPE